VLSLPIPLRILFAAQTQLLAVVAGDPPRHCRLSDQAGGLQTSPASGRLKTSGPIVESSGADASLDSAAHTKNIIASEQTSLRFPAYPSAE
jgi:hypothetical protein